MAYSHIPLTALFAAATLTLAVLWLTDEAPSAEVRVQQHSQTVMFPVQRNMTTTF